MLLNVESWLLECSVQGACNLQNDEAIVWFMGTSVGHALIKPRTLEPLKLLNYYKHLKPLNAVFFGTGLLGSCALMGSAMILYTIRFLILRA